uniref:DNA ligase 1-like n=1 Tax=Nelumbo nucifera TaxID=4432 RepID=A0A822Z6R1_NELNU|nr:TPA_asm: hypothetical protein HUJ06_014643 [Nelumbo nucifera]
MAGTQYFSFRGFLFLFLVFFLFSSLLASALSETQTQRNRFVGRRMLEIEEVEEEEELLAQPKKKFTKTQPKLIEMEEENEQPKKKSTKTKSKFIEMEEEEQPKKKSTKIQTKFIDMEEGEQLEKKTTTKNKAQLIDVDEEPKKKSTKSQTKLIEEDQEEQPKKKSTKVQTGLTEEEEEEQEQPKKKSTKSQTNLVEEAEEEEEEEQPKKKANLLTKNQAKLIKPTTSSMKATASSGTILSNTQLKKLNSTSKSSNSTKSNPILIKKSPDLLKPSTPKNKTVVAKQSQTTTDKNSSELKSKTLEKKQVAEKNAKQEKTQKPMKIDQDEEDDLVSEFRDLPSKIHQSFIPDLERISTTSKVYLSRANKEITKGVKPYVGSKYAPSIASTISCVFVLVPLLLVSLVFNRMKAYFSLQQIVILIQVYLSIYFLILAFSSLVTGLEPLKFFYSTSQSSYICLQVLQTLGYVMYLLLLLMDLVVVFSTETRLGSKLLGLAQTIVGFAVGLHYYATVFHRAVLRQPPKTNWKVHGIYATCFLLICLFARSERRKKAYLQDGEDGKKS